MSMAACRGSGSGLPTRNSATRKSMMISTPISRWTTTISKRRPTSSRRRSAFLEQKDVRDDVVVKHDDHQRRKQRKTNLLHTLFHANREIVADRPLDQQDH